MAGGVPAAGARCRWQLVYRVKLTKNFLLRSFWFFEADVGVAEVGRWPLPSFDHVVGTGWRSSPHAKLQMTPRLSGCVERS
jgi:hypothetical protein